MRGVFLGNPVHWIILIAVAAVLWWMGGALLQTRDFNLFLVILFGAAALAVLAIRLTTRAGDRVTREPFEDE